LKNEKRKLNTENVERRMKQSKTEIHTIA